MPFLADVANTGLGYDNANYVGMYMPAVILHEAPEPSTILLAATGLLGLLAYAWRKRK